MFKFKKKKKLDALRERKTFFMWALKDRNTCESSRLHFQKAIASVEREIAAIEE